MRNQIKCPKCKKFIKGTSQYCPYCDILISSENNLISEEAIPSASNILQEAIHQNSKSKYTKVKNATDSPKMQVPTQPTEFVKPYTAAPQQPSSVYTSSFASPVSTMNISAKNTDLSLNQPDEEDDIALDDMLDTEMQLSDSQSAQEQGFPMQHSHNTVNTQNNLGSTNARSLIKPFTDNSKSEKTPIVENSQDIETVPDEFATFEEQGNRDFYETSYENVPSDDNSDLNNDGFNEDMGENNEAQWDYTENYTDDDSEEVYEPNYDHYYNDVLPEVVAEIKSKTKEVIFLSIASVVGIIVMIILLLHYI
ncbi:MAG: hypothetical protein IKB01_05745 [Lachnospiraceae bacterium]|nr:hypothetical protein [Lachnospiraceae bacterium]